MPTQITKTELDDGQGVLLRVDGEMFYHDAALLRRIVAETYEETGHAVIVDLAELDFLDSEAASVLRQMERSGKAKIEGIEVFLQSAVDMAERA